MVEWTVWKGVWLLNTAFTFFLIMILWLNPLHTPQAEAYAWFFLGFILFFIIDLLILDSLPLGFVIKSITINPPSEGTGTRHPMQWFVPFALVMVFSIALGIAWGGIYAYEITFQNRFYISVPNLFSTIPFTQIITAQTFDIIESGWMVATVEESIWTGMLFPILWGLIFIGLFKVLPEEKSALIVSLIIAALLCGFLTANVFHSFVYSKNLYAYANAQQHFTLSAFAAAATGTILPGLIAHAIHNAAAKAKQATGSYAVLPLEAYIAMGGDQNRMASPT
jgi:hypothetical protein